MIKLFSVEMTHSVWPSQWEGRTMEGQDFYARWRNNELTWGVGDTIREAVKAANSGFGRWETVLKSSPDFMDTFVMLSFTGAELVL